MSDCLVLARTANSRIGIALAQACGPARELERRHLSGPTAARVLAEGVLGAALVGACLGAADECVSLQLKCEGPVEGVLTEATRAGGLRGFTYRKILNTFDGTDGVDLAPVMGSRGMLQVIHSNSRQTLFSGHVEAKPPRVAHALECYYCESHQLQTRVAFHTATAEGYLSAARGVMIQRMPDSDAAAFARVMAATAGGGVEAVLAAKQPLAALEDVFGGDRIEIREERRLQFGCRCSYQKTLALLGSLEASELEEMIGEGEPQGITCHFCGKSYSIPPDDVRIVLDLKRAEMP